MEIVKWVPPLCSPDFGETGKLYDYPTKKILSYRPPA